jgi:hypothetical protein
MVLLKLSRIINYYYYFLNLCVSFKKTFFFFFFFVLRSSPSFANPPKIHRKSLGSSPSFANLNISLIANKTWHRKSLGSSPRSLKFIHKNHWVYLPTVLHDSCPFLLISQDFFFFFVCILSLRLQLISLPLHSISLGL